MKTVRALYQNKKKKKIAMKTKQTIEKQKFRSKTNCILIQKAMPPLRLQRAASFGQGRLEVNRYVVSGGLRCDEQQEIKTRSKPTSSTIALI